MNRRRFLRDSLAAPAAAPFIHAQARTKRRTALIGSGWWGMNILREAIRSDDWKVVGLCDVDDGQLDSAAAEVNKLSGDQPNKYKDYRDLLAKENVEIAIVATPDHWHPLATIGAVNAGAHVYVEKPIGHTIKEGRAMVNAARANKRVVQVGTHRRVSPHNISAMEFLRAGKAGKIGMIRAFVHSPGGGGQGTVPDSEPPQGLDWDMWCGPAPWRPYNKALHPRGFRQFLDYANGTLGDWGIHWMDQILWWTEEKYPRRIYSTGGRFIRQGIADAPDTQAASYDFESFRVLWEHRQYAGNNAEKTAIGCYFYGTEGTLHLGWLDGWTFYPAKKGEPAIHEDPKLNQPDDQNIRELFANFLECIRTGRRPASDIEIGHRSTNVSLLGMLSYKLGRSIEWDGERERIIGDEEANHLLSRPYRAPWKYPEA
ncbi:MAG: Gfo/Idh/MocA family oxidoreductase [Bryobacteraceae bacterium]|nr:Gfo/Idh/MocA family oxidoreductase [Bryobacteraceae bacterium]